MSVARVNQPDDRGEKLGGLHGLGNVLIKARREGLLPILPPGVGGERDGRHVRYPCIRSVNRPELVNERVSVLLRHRNVGNQEVRPPVREQGERVRRRDDTARLRPAR